MEKLHTGAKWAFFSRKIFLFIFISFWLSIIFLGRLTEPSISTNIFPYILILGFIIAVIISYILAQLEYNNWFYEFKKDGVHTQNGIISKHYASVPYVKIQNVDITRGWLARIFGFSTLKIHTAGYGFASAEGSIPALNPQKAEQYRDWLLKIAIGKKQGL